MAAYAKCNKAEADAAVARYFYMEGQPLRLVESKYLKEMLQVRAAMRTALWRSWAVLAWMVLVGASYPLALHAVRAIDCLAGSTLRPPSQLHAGDGQGARLQAALLPRRAHQAARTK